MFLLGFIKFSHYLTAIIRIEANSMKLNCQGVCKWRWAKTFLFIQHNIGNP